MIFGSVGCFGKRTFRQKKFETFRQIFHAETSRIILVLFLVVFRIPVCRILELKKNDKNINVGMMQSIKRASDMSPFPLVPRGPLGAAYIPILLSEVEQEQRPSGNGDREAIVVGAGLCDSEGERAYTGYAPHIIRNVSANVFSLRRFGIIFLPKRPPPCFCRNVRNPLFFINFFVS